MTILPRTLWSVRNRSRTAFSFMEAFFNWIIFRNYEVTYFPLVLFVKRHITMRGLWLLRERIKVCRERSIAARQKGRRVFGNARQKYIAMKCSTLLKTLIPSMREGTKRVLFSNIFLLFSKRGHWYYSFFRIRWRAASTLQLVLYVYDIICNQMCS